MSDLMFEPTGPLQQWQKWANLARLEAIRADKAEALCDKLLSALKAVEWYPDPEDGGICPWCGGEKPWEYKDKRGGGHAPDCRRQAAIAAVEGV